jgi:hypothetical protein
MRFLYLALFILLSSIYILPQEIEAKLGGIGLNDGFSVKDPSGNTLFRVRGDGNAGIGTINPQSKLHISSVSSGLLVNTEHSNEYGYNIISRVNNPWTKSFTVQQNENEQVVIFGNGSATFMGNLGIGTNVPFDAKLAVDGIIKSKEVLVTIENWPDYVFQNDYKLSSLQELEKEIELNGHLPGIPSAKEVQEEGVALGKIQSKFLQKIEELTLYIIEQNKRIGALEEELRKIKE